MCIDTWAYAKERAEPLKCCKTEDQMIHPSTLTYPRTSKHMPLFNPEMFSNLFNVPGVMD